MNEQTIKDFYIKTPYPYIGDGRFRLDDSQGLGITYSPDTVGAIQTLQSLDMPVDNVLIVGCGTIEANCLANLYPEIHIDAIDLSDASIKISKSVARHNGYRNIKHMVTSILDYNPNKTYDIICANGVLHHIPQIDKAMEKIYDLLVDGGIFTGMVYNKTERPRSIRTYNEHFKKHEYTVDRVKEYLEYYADEPAKKWFLQYEQSVPEITDTWLHPYFVEYSLEEWNKVLFQYYQYFHIKVEGSKLIFSCIKGKDS